MADDVDDLASRLDRIEGLLRRGAVPAAHVPAGPEVRSARSIVSRIDDVWVAVTEGNERVVASIERLRPGGDGADEVAGRLRLIEEALAGIADLLGERGGGPVGTADLPAAVERLDGEIRRLGQRMDALARAVETSATRSGDSTLTDRIGRLRDQFRR